MINLTSIILAETASKLGFPYAQIAFRNLYSALIRFITSSLKHLEISSVPLTVNRIEAAENIVHSYFTYITKSRFLLRSPAENRLFEGVVFFKKITKVIMINWLYFIYFILVLVSLVEIIQNMLRLNIAILTDTFQVLFKLIECHT